MSIYFENEVSPLWKPKPFVVPLRPHPFQKQSIDLWTEFRELGGERGLFELPTGTGKAILALLMGNVSGRTLFCAHRGELLTQPMRSAEEIFGSENVNCGLVMGEDDNYDASDFVFASIPTICKDGRLERLLESHARDPFALMIVDECFPAGTMLNGNATGHGVTIENIMVGDTVYACNHSASRFDPRKVLRTFKSKPTRMVGIHYAKEYVLYCTPSHPILTSGQSNDNDPILGPKCVYQKAEKIKSGDFIITAVFGTTARSTRERVDFIEEIQPTYDGTFGGVCPDGLVYNIEVEDEHTYIANGVVVHNCHHAAAASYKKVMDAFPGLPKVGLTATPSRADRKGLAPIWGARPLFRMTLDEAIRDNWLCDYEARSILCEDLELQRAITAVTSHKGKKKKTTHPVNYDLDSPEDEAAARAKNGDFDDQELDKEFIRAKVAEKISEAVIEVVKAEGVKPIVFAPTVDIATRIANLIGESGISAEIIFGIMGKADRANKIEEHKSGKIRVLVNVSCLTEGYNDPSVDCIVVARPTRSKELYRQMVGRGLRKFPGKNKCIIFDLVGAHDVHGLVNAEDMLDAHELKRKGKGGGAFAIEDGGIGAVVSLGNAMLGRRGEDEEGKGHKKPRPRAVWLTISEHVFALAAGDEGYYILCRDPDSEALWRGHQLPKDAWTFSGLTPLVERPVSQAIAFGILEDHAREKKVFILSQDTAKWRAGKPTPDQIDLLQKIGVAKIPETKGEASDLISANRLKKKMDQTPPQILRAKGVMA